MGLESEILADFRRLLAEHGVKARWQGVQVDVLASRARAEQQIDMGGFVAAPDLSLRVPKTAFPDALPRFGDRIELGGEEYRILKVLAHPRSPLLTLGLGSPDE